VGISPRAVISPTATLGRNVDVHPLATIGDDVQIGDGTAIHSGVHVMAGSRIGPGVTIFPNAVLYENTIVGPRCVIHAGAVLGAYGFGYCCVEGRHRLSAQLGNVVLEADVEVGAGTTIDRGTYGATTIGEGTKIDNQVMIAHNCRIGRHNMLCAQVGIAGSTTTGDYVVMAGQVGVRDHVHVGTKAVLGAMAGVINDVPDNGRFVGIPATPEREQMVKQAALAKLPEMRRQIKQLQASVDKLLRQQDFPQRSDAG
jgi:UDP-3-O-[3-hydroxymyristoyl] glucosamine N-acyltransferase